MITAKNFTEQYLIAVLLETITREGLKCTSENGQIPEFPYSYVIKLVAFFMPEFPV